jgi:hypothetical protein
MKINYLTLGALLLLGACASEPSIETSIPTNLAKPANPVQAIALNSIAEYRESLRQWENAYDDSERVILEEDMLANLIADLKQIRTRSSNKNIDQIVTKALSDYNYYVTKYKQATSVSRENTRVFQMFDVLTKALTRIERLA